MKIRKSERGETALNDYMIAIVIFMIGAVTVSYLYINIYKLSAKVKIDEAVIGYITEICEQIDLTSYENVSKVEQVNEIINNTLKNTPTKDLVTIECTEIEKYDEMNNNKSYMQNIENGTYIIRSALDNNYVLDVNGASKEDGANVQIWQNGNVSNQRFNIVYVRDGYYKIISENSGKVLDVANASKDDGSNIQQFTENGTAAQLWEIKDVGNGYYSFFSKCNGKCLDVSGGIVENGRNIQIFTSNGTNAQKFKLEKFQINNSEENTDYVERIHLRIRYESLNKNIRDYYINKIKVKEI